MWLCSELGAWSGEVCPETNHLMMMPFVGTRPQWCSHCLRLPVCALGNAESGLCWQHDGSWQARRAAVGGLPCVCTHSSQAAVSVALNKILLSSEPYDEVKRRTARHGRTNPKPKTLNRAHTKAKGAQGKRRNTLRRRY